MVLVLAACGADSYESLSEDIDTLLAEQIPMSADDKARIMSLREQAEQLHGDGKSEESVEALKQARRIFEAAEDAELLRKSEG
jgi:hypothetical protein